MKCPFCEQEMYDCYLESNGVMYITEKLHPILGPRGAKAKKRIEYEETGFPISYCKSCEKIVFDVPNIDVE